MSSIAIVDYLKEQRMTISSRVVVFLDGSQNGSAVAGSKQHGTGVMCYVQ